MTERVLIFDRDDELVWFIKGKPVLSIDFMTAKRYSNNRRFKNKKQSMRFVRWFLLQPEFSGCSVRVESDYNYTQYRDAPYKGRVKRHYDHRAFIWKNTL